MEKPTMDDQYDEPLTLPPSTSLEADAETNARIGQPLATEAYRLLETRELAIRQASVAAYNLARRLLGQEAEAEAVLRDIFGDVVQSVTAAQADLARPTQLSELTVRAVFARRDRTTSNGKPTRRPIRQVSPADMKRLLEPALATLPDTYRHVFVLADVKGFSVTAVAQMLGLGLAVAKARLHRARLLLSDTLVSHLLDLRPEESC
jgi:RNA polymerase sigma-70 factor (ECF subfamily)